MPIGVLLVPILLIFNTYCLIGIYFTLCNNCPIVFCFFVNVVPINLLLSNTLMLFKSFMTEFSIIIETRSMDLFLYDRDLIMKQLTNDNTYVMLKNTLYIIFRYSHKFQNLFGHFSTVGTKVFISFSGCPAHIL